MDDPWNEYWDIECCVHDVPYYYPCPTCDGEDDDNELIALTETGDQS